MRTILAVLWPTLLLLVACQSAPPEPAAPPPPIATQALAAEPTVLQAEPTQAAPETATPLPPAPSATAQPSPTATATFEPAALLPAPTLFETAWADRSPFAAGLIASEQGVLDELPGASVYHLELDLGDDLRTIAGVEEVLYTNREEVPLEAIYFRLFPNLASGSTTVSELTVNGELVEPGFEAENSAMRVALPTALAPGEQVVIAMDFAVTVPAGEGGNYGTFAFVNEVLALAHAYPMIAVYDDEGWNIEIAPTIGDVVYADSSFYLVRVTAPADQVMAASGVELAREETAERQTVTYAAGPMRDFYLATSATYTRTTTTVGATTVNSYAPTDLTEGSELALQQAVAALESFNDRFGVYPYSEFDLVSTTTFALGVEYPGIVAILVDLYQPGEGGGGPSNTALLESVVAHEVAHQWFYGLVGNDQIDEPWLDEALAQFLTLVYYSDVYGPQGSNGFRGSLEGRWRRVDRADIPIGLPVAGYSPQEYSAIVYGRGPLFIEALSEAMGPAVFAEFMRDYFQSYEYQIATGIEFKALAEQHCGCDLTALFEEWVF